MTRKIRFLATAGLIFGVSLGKASRDLHRSPADVAPALEEVLANRKCPCGCGRFLPGNRAGPACFGCSIGKSDISQALEALLAGVEPAEVAAMLDEVVLIEVFGDYTDEALDDVWKLARRVANEFKQHRVVLRSTARTGIARRAAELAECAREGGRFGELQQLLVAHPGPWDDVTLLELCERVGLDRDDVQECLESMNIGDQVRKDREHATIYGVHEFPSIVVNRDLVPATDTAIRRAIRSILEDDSI